MEGNHCKQCGGKLDKFGRKLPILQPDGYSIPELAAASLIVRSKDSIKEFLLIQRGRENDPYKGKWAIPGGHVKYGEDPINTCIRELEEECSLKEKVGSEPKLFAVYGDPQRSKKAHVITIVYIVEVEDSAMPKSGSDAADAKFISIEEIEKNPDMMAFDHGKILKDFIGKQ